MRAFQSQLHLEYQRASQAQHEDHRKCFEETQRELEFVQIAQRTQVMAQKEMLGGEIRRLWQAINDLQIQIAQRAPPPPSPPPHDDDTP